MRESDKIEYYLLALERVLAETSLAKRSEIIFETKNKIENLKSTGLSVDEVLVQMGPVDQIAIQYGVVVAGQSSRLGRALKWLLLVFLLFFLMFTVGAWWFFHNFMKSNGNFEFRVNEDQFSVGGNPVTNYSDEESRFEESKDSQALGLKKIEFKFSNGKVRYSTSADSEVSWQCKITGIDGEGRSSVDGDTVIVNLIESTLSKCDVKIPQGMSLISKGGNGDVQIIEPMFRVDIKLGNGQVEIRPAPKVDYIYDLEIVNGRVGEFISSQKPDALSVRVRMTNGTIQRENE